MRALEAICDYFDLLLDWKREVACFLDDRMQVLSLSTSNSAGHVEFDWFGIWPQIRDSGRRPSHVLMVHTHPPGCDRASDIDENMVKGWALALGVPVWFMIACDGESVFYRCERKGGKSPLVLAMPGEVETTFSRRHIETVRIVLEGLSVCGRNLSGEDCLEAQGDLNTAFGSKPETQCPACGGTGEIEEPIGEVSADMASDAGDKSLVGQVVMGTGRCRECGGSGMTS